MNAYAGVGIMPGSQVICLFYEDVMHRMPLEDGMVVVVERVSNGGLMRERSLKEVMLFDDRTEFQPRSTEKRHKAIVVPHDYQADEGTAICVLAVLRRVVSGIIRFSPSGASKSS